MLLGALTAVLAPRLLARAELAGPGTGGRAVGLAVRGGGRARVLRAVDDVQRGAAWHAVGEARVRGGARGPVVARPTRSAPPASGRTRPPSALEACGGLWKRRDADPGGRTRPVPGVGGGEAELLLRRSGVCPARVPGADPLVVLEG
ncbi:hypothetical protein LV779_39300 [Streptomyces thinghirensis]|nr:hypothetical protein [Streptomyces thinghirensis]